MRPAPAFRLRPAAGTGAPQTPWTPQTATLAISVTMALTMALMAGCATRPATDGPGARPPPGLERVPDAEPRIEPVRPGGPNKPYEVMGQRYVPLPADAPWSEAGLASWYGRKFHGQPTSSGEPYDMYAMTAAHKTLPIPSYARVRNPANGREVIVRINDRGPFAAGRVIDLSYTAALRLGLLGGVAPVEVQRITHGEIRAGLRPSPAPRIARSPGPADAQGPDQASAPAAGPGPGAAAYGPAGAAAEAGAVAVAGAEAQPILPPQDAPVAERPTGQVDEVWLQMAAFRTREAAASLKQRLLLDAADLPGVALAEGGGWFRVQVGPYPTRAQAWQARAPLERQFGFSAVMFQRAPASPTQ
jgi:rare lipoprotein A